tara:strand:- start:1306 stop:1617 length:312 start_codon:yes stop_codon:yes gene_type:complete
MNDPQKDYLQRAYMRFNTNSPNWWNWKKVDSDGNKIPNDQRMTYENTIVQNKDAVKPSKSDVDAMIQTIKDAETAAIDKKASGKQKLKDLGLDDDEIKALTGA